MFRFPHYSCQLNIKLVHVVYIYIGHEGLGFVSISLRVEKDSASVITSAEGWLCVSAPLSGRGR